ncbi:M48 family metallopeptidase [Janthinobacterium agaricidamnosum]|uniref:Peptidase, M48 family domain protein n=1 Tax=Janthinobacterium agaricidamnosum NBRC 102515 = DSM 9628 TaxID=1349767 RepID=W0VDX2_9BURK|nr:M48 family metallopeptidase [Janthinobacterium agaricidamnosum]CDG85588.1 peptidase, M48 family domain protein [Janthinobacterium agaricidamnosum NBRC 102515 = DSM 9628]
MSTRIRTFSALLSGRPVSAHFFGRQLLIAPDGPVVDAGDLVISVGGIDGPELLLNWLDGHGVQHALKPAAAADIAMLLESAPPLLQPQLAQWQQRGRNTRQIWGWLGAIAGGALLLGALLWWQTPHAAGWLAGRIPVSVEQQLGRAALAEIRQQGGLSESGPLQQAVQDIGRRLTAGSRYQYRWIVKQDDTVNAFAIPGGIVVVHTALLKQAANPTELAAVLAHEVQHIEQRHSLRQMIASLGWGALLAVTVGDVSAVAALLAHQAGALYFSRDMEDEADRLGLQTLQRARIKPDGMLTFFKKIGENDSAGGLPAWISSHPQTPERIARITALMASQPCPSCQDLNTDGWKALTNSIGTAQK